MPGYLVTQNATVTCAHQGQARVAAALAGITIDGACVVAQSASYTVTGCPFPPQSGGPCATGLWTTGTVRVTSRGMPLAIQGTPGTCAPTGVPMMVMVDQVRVTAT